MYFSRMPLNAARRGTRFFRASPQAMHAAILAAFPPGVSTSNADGRVLWRLDTAGNEVFLYIVSPEAPDLTHVIEQAGWPTLSTWETRDYGPLLAQITAGQHYAFRLIANPVRQPRDPELGGKRVGHVTAAQQEQWLMGKAERSGFRLRSGVDSAPAVVVSDREVKKFSRGSGMVTLSTARFDGQLEVADAALFRRALTAGIGSAKGYGCGLMTLARV